MCFLKLYCFTDQELLLPIIVVSNFLHNKNLRHLYNHLIFFNKPRLVFNYEHLPFAYCLCWVILLPQCYIFTVRYVEKSHRSTRIIENDPTYGIPSHHFEQDGATQHYVPAVREFLVSGRKNVQLNDALDIMILIQWIFLRLPKNNSGQA